MKLCDGFEECVNVGLELGTVLAVGIFDIDGARELLGLDEGTTDKLGYVER